MNLHQEIVTVRGRHYQIGFEAGRRLADAISANLEIFWKNVETLGLSQDELMGWTYEDESRLPLNLREEIRGLADGSGQIYRELLAYNLYRGGLACDC